LHKCNFPVFKSIT